MFILENIKDKLKAFIWDINHTHGNVNEILINQKLKPDQIEDIINDGLHEAIDSLQIDLNKLHNLIQDKYFINKVLSDEN